MTIKFVDKNARIVVINVYADEVEIVMDLLSKLPDSEFIHRPIKDL